MSSFSNAINSIKKEKNELTNSEKILLRKKKLARRVFRMGKFFMCMVEINNAIIYSEKKRKKKNKSNLKIPVKNNIRTGRPPKNSYKHGPLIVVKKDMKDHLDDEKVKEWLSSPDGFLEGMTSTRKDPTKLYDYQIAHVKNKSKFRACSKSRQIGFSFICVAGEALAKSHLTDDNTSIFISYNRDEAAEKIIAARQLYETIPLEYRKKIVTDNKHSLVFRNTKGETTRILSTAQRPPRGKGHNTDVYLDEFAFYQWASKIFTASAPVISRGTGVLTVGSTPLGARGKFYEILTDTRQFPTFSRQFIPWWHCPDLCLDIQKAFKEAPTLTTRERVEKFGLPTIKVLLNSMPLDDFQQEYELAFVDENVSYFPYETVNACVYNTDKDIENFDEIDDKRGTKLTIDNFDKTKIEMKYPKIKLFQCNSIEELSWKINNGEIRPNLVAGYDVGRKKDKSELYILEEIEINENIVLQVVRFSFQIDRQKFEFQKNYLRNVLTNIPIKKMVIDAMGIGMNIAEDLHTEFPDIVEELAMEGEWKDRAAQSMKIRFENQIIAIPDDEQLKRQIGSIKKKVSTSGNVSYDAEKDKDHHGDKFWALALASYAGVSTNNMKFSSSDSFVGGETRIIQPAKFKNSKRNSEIESIPGIYNMAGQNFDIPGIGRMPAPLAGLLTPGEFITPGSSAWLTEFHTPIGRR